MKKNIFRKSSIDRVSSPDQLDEYIRVVKPSVWLVLCAIVLLLTGFLAWACLGTIHTLVPASIVSEGNQLSCYINLGDSARVKPGMIVTANGEKGVILEAPVLHAMQDQEKQTVMQTGTFDDGSSYCYITKIEFPELKDGVYPAEIIVESINPVTFVLH